MGTLSLGPKENYFEWVFQLNWTFIASKNLRNVSIAQNIAQGLFLDFGNYASVNGLN